MLRKFSHKATDDVVFPPTNIKVEGKEEVLVCGLTLDELREQLKQTTERLKLISTKRYFQWDGLSNSINKNLEIISISKLKYTFERKLGEELQLQKDLYRQKYARPIFFCCLFCCPYSLKKKFKRYRSIDDEFEIALANSETLQRDIYFYINVEYVKLFIVYRSLKIRISEEFNKQIVKALIENGEALKAKVMAEQENKRKQEQKKENEKQSDSEDYDDIESELENQENPENSPQAKQINPSKDSVSIKMETNTLSRAYSEGDQPKLLNVLNCIKNELQLIIKDDLQEIETTSQYIGCTFRGFIQIDKQEPIESLIELSECKLKTSHFFCGMSTNGFDLRVYMLSRSRRSANQFKLDPLYPNSMDFNFRFWLSQNDRSQQNLKKIEQFMVFSQRVGIKQKIYRMCRRKKLENLPELTSIWMPPKAIRINRNIEKAEIDKSESVSSSSSSEQAKQTLWWVSLGQKLIQAIVEVSKHKIKEQKEIEGHIISKHQKLKRQLSRKSSKGNKSYTQDNFIKSREQAPLDFGNEESGRPMVHDMMRQLDDI